MRSRHVLATTLIAAVAFAISVACQPKPAEQSPTAADTIKARTDSLQLAAKVEHGERLFLAYCAMCHGDGGNGDGEVAGRLAKEGIKVARLNDAERVSKLSREQIIEIIHKGGGHTQRSNFMPSWANTLTPDIESDLADFVQALPQRNPAIPSATTGEFLAAPPGVPADGRVLFVHHCSACHGEFGKGDGPFAAQIKDKQKVEVRNLTDSSYVGTRTDEQLFATVTLGGGHFKKSVMMPAWTQTLSPEQIKSIVAYVREISHTAKAK